MSDSNVGIEVSYTKTYTEVLELDKDKLHGLLCAVAGFFKHKGWIPSGPDDNPLSNGQMAFQFINENATEPIKKDLPEADDQPAWELLRDFAAYLHQQGDSGTSQAVAIQIPNFMRTRQ